MKKPHKIIISFLIILIFLNIGYFSSKFFKNTILDLKKKNNFSVLNYTANALNLFLSAHRGGGNISLIGKELFNKDIYTDFDVVILDESKMIVFNTNIFEYVKYNKMIIDKRIEIFSQKIYDHFIYDFQKSSYLVSKRTVMIANQELTILVISQIDANLNFILQYQLVVIAIFLFIALIIIYALFSQDNKISHFSQMFSGAITQPAIEKYGLMPFLIVDEKGVIVKTNQLTSQLLNTKMNTLYYQEIGKIIPELHNYKNYMTDAPYNLLEVTIDETIRDVIIKILPYQDLMNDKEYHIIFIIDHSVERQKIITSENELKKLQILYEINKAIALLSDPKIIIENILNITRKMINFTSVMVFIPENNFLKLFFTNQPELIKQKTLKIKFGQGLAGTVANTLKGMILNNAEKSVLAAQVPGTDDVPEHLIAVPMTTKNELIGVLLFSREYDKKFAYEDLSFLDMVASSTASILHNSILLQQLSTSEKKYRALINHSTIGVFIIKKGKTIFINNTFIKLLNIHPELHIGLPFVDLVHQDDKDFFNKSLAKFMIDKSHKPVQIRLNINDGNILVTEMSFRQIVWENQTIIMGNIIDITERISLNKQLVQSQKFESMGTLAGGIAHDFKNILTAIIGASEIMMRKSKDPDALKYGKIIKTSADRGADLAKRLLGYSRKSSEEDILFDINAQLDEVINIAMYTMPQSIELDIELHHEALPFEGDPIKIQQCILNLAVNARDAIGKEGKLSIKSCILEDNTPYLDKFDFDPKKVYTHICVSDTGHGISQENITKIFDPYFTTKEIGKGTGIGLATTISIIKDYKGFINVDSEINVGSTFNILLPLSDKEIVIADESTVEENTSEMKILLVDDEDIILQIVAEMFSELGHIVKTASSGDEAIEILKTSQTFDYVFIDRRMPKMDGNELFYHIREINEDIKVVMASGNQEDDEIKKMREDGLYDYITKPYKIADIQRFLQQLNSNREA